MSATIQIFGNINRGEFRRPFRSLLASVPKGVAVKYGEKSSKNFDFASIIFTILFQSYPGEFSQTLVDKRITANPFAPILLLAGTACEGELRTGKPPQGAFRIYSYQFDHCLCDEITKFLLDKPSIFSLPRTAEPDDFALYLRKNNPFSEKMGQNDLKKCRILSNFVPFGFDSAMSELLFDEFHSQGYTVEMLCDFDDNSFSGKILADADDSPFSEILKGVQRLRALFADVEITVCINSPRINEIEELFRIGVVQILSKPSWDVIENDNFFSGSSTQ